jgi:hypothetical protein
MTREARIETVEEFMNDVNPDHVDALMDVIINVVLEIHSDVVSMIVSHLKKEEIQEAIEEAGATSLESIAYDAIWHRILHQQMPQSVTKERE